MTIKRFEDIEAWQKARELTKAVYLATASGAFARDFVLRDQVRRAAVSIVSNIAEGFERGGNREFLQFLSLSKGSCGELRAQLYLVKDQGYLEEKVLDALMLRALQVSRMITGLIRYLRQSEMRGSKFQAPAATPPEKVVRISPKGPQP